MDVTRIEYDSRNEKAATGTAILILERINHHLWQARRRAVRANAADDARAFKLAYMAVFHLQRAVRKDAADKRALARTVRSHLPLAA